MTIVLSCGHEVQDFDHAYHVMYKTYDRDGSRAIAYAVFCGPCEDRLRQQGQIFDSEEGAEHWVNNL